MKEVPPAGLIERAKDNLKMESPGQLEAQEKEFRFALGNEATPDVVKGFQLGVETMRVMQATNVKAVRESLSDQAG